MGENIHRRSADLFERACRVLPGGVSRNTLLRDTPLLYARQGSGCQVVDVDGVERIDFANNMASLIHGHAHPAIIERGDDTVEAGLRRLRWPPKPNCFTPNNCAAAPQISTRFVS